jgi:hypothetical protein
MTTSDAFLYVGAKGDLTAGMWAQKPFVALLMRSDYVPSFMDHSGTLRAAEIDTQRYERKPVLGRVAVVDEEAEAVLLLADNIIWSSIGPGVDGPTVGGFVVMRTEPQSMPIAFFRLSAYQLNGRDYALNISENDGVLLRLV